MIPRLRAPLLSALALAALLPACEPFLPGAGAPASGPVLPSPTPATPPSPESEAVRAYYAGVQTNLLSQGLLRTDGGARDTPFTDRQLAENFIRIALFDEYVSERGVLVPAASESRLRRWDGPIRMSVEFGASVPDAQRLKDRGSVTAYAARLSRLTGLPIAVGAADPNFTVLVLNEDERRTVGPRLRALVRGVDPAAVAAVVNMAPETYCTVFSFSSGKSAAYSRAIAVIRGEHPDLLRLSCIHEELAQGLGLVNDSPSARPSIFNDDEEFALLTRQDEMLLRMLYDPRLKLGMTPDDARPLVETIAVQLVGPGQG
ncbi:MAG: DUF2927 domain-containing protein [Paracoccaceae bacterium]